MGRPTLSPSAFEDSRPEIQWYRCMIDQGIPRDLRPATVWDVGCRNWSYLPAWLERFPEAKLRGVELDGGRRYWNLYRRHDHALAYSEIARERGHDATCQFADFRNVHLSSALEFNEDVLFAFFFPFVSPDPCLSWGIPTEYASFDALIRYSLASSELTLARPHWFSAHQGAWEADIARESYRSFGFKVRESVLQVDETGNHSGLLAGWPSSHSIHVMFVSQD